MVNRYDKRHYSKQQWSPTWFLDFRLGFAVFILIVICSSVVGESEFDATIEGASNAGV